MQNIITGDVNDNNDEYLARMHAWSGACAAGRRHNKKRRRKEKQINTIPARHDKSKIFTFYCRLCQLTHSKILLHCTSFVSRWWYESDTRGLTINPIIIHHPPPPATMMFIILVITLSSYYCALSWWHVLRPKELGISFTTIIIYMIMILITTLLLLLNAIIWSYSYI